MSRLTDRCWRNLDPWECCGQNFHCSRKLNDDGGCINGCIVPKLYKHLAEYEDLEEQGLLLKLPCKIGSIVYVVGTKCLKGEEPIGGCGKNICDGCILNETYTVFETDVDNHLMKLLLFEHNENFIFNKTVFLTKEEAEKALKRLECAE